MEVRLPLKRIQTQGLCGQVHGNTACILAFSLQLGLHNSMSNLRLPCITNLAASALMLYASSSRRAALTSKQQCRSLAAANVHGHAALHAPISSSARAAFTSASDAPLPPAGLSSSALPSWVLPLRAGLAPASWLPSSWKSGS